MTKSICISAIILFCIAMIETAILSNINILPAVPDLLLLASLYFSLLNGRAFGEVNGFISGVILDFLTGSPFGFNCLYRTVLCYISGFFSKSISFNGFVMPAFIVFVGTILKAFLIWIISLFFPLIINNYNIFSLPFLFELIENVLLAPFIFKFLGAFNRYIAFSLEEND